MKIKNHIHFFIGVFFGICFAINLVKGRDTFTLCIYAIAAISNITIGIYD